MYMYVCVYWEELFFSYTTYKYMYVYIYGIYRYIYASIYL